MTDDQGMTVNVGQRVTFESQHVARIRDVIATDDIRPSSAS